MASTYELIASVTVGSGGASSIDFTSIPSTYTDLVVVYSIRSSQSASFSPIYFSFNGVTTNRTAKLLTGDGSTAGSASIGDAFTFNINAASSTGSTFSNCAFYVPNYAGSTAKSFSADLVSENNATTSYAWLAAGLWNNTSAITAVNLTNSTYSFVQYSTAYLYGVKNA